MTQITIVMYLFRIVHQTITWYSIPVLKYAIIHKTFRTTNADLVSLYAFF